MLSPRANPSAKIGEPAQGWSSVFAKILVYPLLFAAFPVLALAASNAGEYSGRDLRDVLSVIIVFFGLIQLALTIALRGRASPHVAPLLTMGLVALFYCVAPAQNVIQLVSYRLSRPWVVFGLATLPIAGITVWLTIHQAALAGFTRFMAVAGAILTAFSASQFGIVQVRAWLSTPDTELARELARPITSDKAVEHLRNNPRRDIYLIVLDRYANADVLREYLGFDNRPFEDSLRSHGFIIPSSVRSNYMQSILSIPSLLNFAHLTPLASTFGPRARDTSPLVDLIENNRTERFFHQEKYQFIFFPSPWWSPTSSNWHADTQFRAWSGLDLSRELTKTDFRRALKAKTLLRFLTPRRKLGADHLLRTLEGLKNVPLLPEPTFSFAHLISPHGPYMFDPVCGVLDQQIDDDVLPVALRNQAYLAQLQCLNKQLLDLVRVLLARSEVEPIILFQGDHGTNTSEQQNKTGSWGAAEWREQAGAFGAYYLPAGGGSAFPDTVTLVNVIPNVLRYYFGVDVQRRPDDIYFSSPPQPYTLTRVSGRDLKAP